MYPVSPVNPESTEEVPLCEPCEEDEDDGFENLGDSTVPAHTDSQDALPGGDRIDADGEDVVQPARGMPMPKLPSDAEVAAHNLTHLPYRSWCPHCVAARRPKSHHLFIRVQLAKDRSSPCG